MVFHVALFVARIPNRNSKPAILLRESDREGGKFKTRTNANLTKWPPERITAMERLCRGEFDGWTGGEATSGEVFGVLCALKHMADQVGVGITRVLGPSTESRLALFQTLARMAGRGYRRCAGHVRLQPRRQEGEAPDRHWSAHRRRRRAFGGATASTCRRNGHGGRTG